jgi:outer membrane lipoprotein SlyB
MRRRCARPTASENKPIDVQPIMETSAMKRYQKGIAGLAALLVIGGCASTPPGPDVPVMPAQGKPFQTFQQDQAVCKGYADQVVGPAVQSANNQAIGTAVIGTLLGAGLGAAIGGGRGAAIGAASGAVVGTAAGANGSAWSQMSIQQHYDVAYSQCMYARGNQVPGYVPYAGYPLPPPPTGPVVTPANPQPGTVTPVAPSGATVTPAQ